MKLFVSTIILFLFSESLYSQNEILKFFPIKLGDSYYNSTNKIYSEWGITNISKTRKETDTFQGKIISRQQIAFDVSNPTIVGSKSKRIWALFENDTLTELHLEIKFNQNDYLNAKKQFDLLFHDMIYFYNNILIGDIYVDNDKGGNNNRKGYYGENRQKVEGLVKLDSRNGIKIGEGIWGRNPKNYLDNMITANLEITYEHPVIGYSPILYDNNTRIYIIELKIINKKF